jgi:putative ABC transport system permease protein
LEAIEAIHVDWSTGAKIPGQITPVEEIRQMDLSPKNITAALIGVNSKLQIFQLQRWINEYPEESLSSILPGVALQELWRIVGVVENIMAVMPMRVVKITVMEIPSSRFSTTPTILHSS